MSKGFTAAVGITIVAGLAIGVGLAMYQSGALAAGKAGAQAPAAIANASGTAARTQTDQGAAAARGFPGVAGTVESLVGSTLTVTTASGPVKITLTADTAIRKTTDIKPAELTAGEAVTVVGVKAADGAIVARSLQAGESLMLASGDQSGTATLQGAGQSAVQAGRAAGQQGGMAQQGQPGGQPGQGSFANMTQVAGTIETVGTDKIGIKTASGSVTVTLSDQTTVRKTVAGAQSDLVKGVTVMAAGQPGADGAMIATSIQIGGEFGQPGRIRPAQGQ